MNSPATPQIIGNLCVGVAALAFLLPLHKLLSGYAGRHVNDDQWVPQALWALVPMWIALMVAMSCATSLGGFDNLRFSRPWLHTFAVAATASLGALTFILVAFYIRPGFTPRGLYVPGIYLVPLSTLLLAVLSLNPRLGAAVPIQWLRLPWTIAATVCLVACVGVGGTWFLRTGAGRIAGFIHYVRNPGPSTQEILNQIATLDPDTHFDDLLRRSSRHQNRKVSEAAITRIRSHPRFLERLATQLESGQEEPALELLSNATLTSEEQTRLARPARRAMERWVHEIPAPNYTTRQHLKRLRNWGEGVLPPISEKFAASKVDFAPVLEEFREKVDARR